eukprot:m.135180 g.135180  ORF g.135180 m.135180 type:complete len:221 (+) comp9861_c0_seq1:140-802(+)
MSRLISVDVECIANGKGHNDRRVAHVAVIDGETEEVLLNVKIRQRGHVESYLEPITGLSARDFDESIASNHVVSFAEMKEALDDILGDDVLLVGQGIDSDIAWLKLVQGQHFGVKRDLANDFKSWNPKYRNYNFHSLMATAETLLGLDMSGSHDPAIDALASVQLYKKFIQPGNDKLLKTAQSTMLRARKNLSVAKRLDYKCDGVCMAKFFKKKCFCGQP